MHLLSRPIVCAAALTAISTPLPVLAQEAPSPAARQFGETMSDPAEQERLAGTLAAVSQILLDLPLAPLAEAVESAAGEELGDIEPDTTLRSLAGPGADHVPAQIQKRVPQVMGAMAGMADSYAELVPVLRNLADRMRAAIPKTVE